MTAFWPEHEPMWKNSEPPEEMRGAAVVNSFRQVLEERGTAVTAQEVLAILGGVIIDLAASSVSSVRAVATGA
ncbi:hypothetical protein ACWC9U_40005, partial [Streptomyces sp. 900116325]